MVSQAEDLATQKNDELSHEYGIKVDEGIANSQKEIQI